MRRAGAFFEPTAGAGRAAALNSAPGARRLAAGFEAGLDAAALLFFPLLVLVPRGIAPLASVAGLLAAGLVLSIGRPVRCRGLALPAGLAAALLAWGCLSALWSIDPWRSLEMTARLAGLFAAGLALAVAAGSVSAPQRLSAFLLGGFILGIAMAAIDLASHGALSKPFSDRFYQPSWLNQASVAFAILLLPVGALVAARRHRIAALLFALAAAATICALAGTAAKVALAAGLVVALLCCWRRAGAARLGALAAILVIITAPLTFARLDRAADLVATADAIKLSAGHRLLIWSFVGDRIAEHPLAGWGLEFVAGDPRRQGPDPAGRDLAAAASAQRSAAAVARARSAGGGGARAVGWRPMVGARRSQMAAPVRRRGRRQPRHRVCRNFRHLWDLGGMVAGDPVVLAVSGPGHGAGRRRRREADLMRVFAPLLAGHWRTAGPFATAAEAAGFDAVTTVELGHDPFAPLAFAALATSRIELTTSVAVAFPRSPTVIASQAWDLHANSGGRFVLGLGSQVKGHNERRFGIAWTPPAPRLRDYVGALRAIWRCWEAGEKLDYQGEHYRLNLMPPDFSPEPTGLPAVPVAIAAVGEAMLRVAGEVADGVRLHPLCSRRYLEEVCLPRIGEGMRRSGRSREHFDVHGGGFVATGADESELAAAIERVRQRIAFYASTRSYLPILSLHGQEELGLKLHRLSIDGRWHEMAAEVSDEIVHLFAACGTYREIAGVITARFGGLADSIDLSFPASAPAGAAARALVRPPPHSAPLRGFRHRLRREFYNPAAAVSAPSTRSAAKCSSASARAARLWAG